MLHVKLDNKLKDLGYASVEQTNIWLGGATILF